MLISPFYNSFQLTDNNIFQQAVSCFETIILYIFFLLFQSFIDLMIKQSIVSDVTCAIIAAIDRIGTKHKKEMLALQKIIKKSLLLRDFAFSTLFPNPNTFSKALPLMNLHLKITNKWNQSDLNYFDLYLDKTHSEGKIVLVDKDVYYGKVVLFVQYLQSLVTFKKATFVKVNVVISF